MAVGKVGLIVSVENAFYSQMPSAVHSVVGALAQIFVLITNESQAN